MRATDSAARLLVNAGSARSPTVATLLQTIESSDLIVYVATGFIRFPGRLDFVCAKRGNRFLRITVNVPDAEPRLIASIAHELQHAVEIAAAPDVTDAAALARFYERHGERVSRDEYCTKAAQRVADAVRIEVGSRADR